MWLVAQRCSEQFQGSNGSYIAQPSLLTFARRAVVHQNSLVEQDDGPWASTHRGAFPSESLVNRPSVTSEHTRGQWSTRNGLSVQVEESWVGGSSQQGRGQPSLWEGAAGASRQQGMGQPTRRNEPVSQPREKEDVSSPLHVAKAGGLEGPMEGTDRGGVVKGPVQVTGRGDEGLEATKRCGVVMPGDNEKQLESTGQGVEASDGVGHGVQSGSQALPPTLAQRGACSIAKANSKAYSAAYMSRIDPVPSRPSNAPAHQEPLRPPNVAYISCTAKFQMLDTPSGDALELARDKWRTEQAPGASDGGGASDGRGASDERGRRSNRLQAPGMEQDAGASDDARNEWRIEHATDWSQAALLSAIHPTLVGSRLPAVGTHSKWEPAGAFSLIEAHGADPPAAAYSSGARLTGSSRNAASSSQQLLSKQQLELMVMQQTNADVHPGSYPSHIRRPDSDLDHSSLALGRNSDFDHNFLAPDYSLHLRFSTPEEVTLLHSLPFSPPIKRLPRLLP